MMRKINSPASYGRKIGYARVSTKAQKLDLQISALKEAGCDVIFSDHGVSGRIAKRKGLSEALGTLQAGDTLVVYKIDRLGRSVLHLARLAQQLEHKGAGFQSISQGMNITSASGRLVFYIFAAFAEFESHINGERTKGGMEASKAKGAKFGRHLKLSDADVEKAQRMLERGAVSLGTVAGAFDVSPSTLRRAIKRVEGGP